MLFWRVLPIQAEIEDAELLEVGWRWQFGSWLSSICSQNIAAVSFANSMYNNTVMQSIQG